jgi:hypothetical protein
MNAPAPIPKDAEAIRDLAWWAVERERQGTDWQSLMLGAMRAAGVIAPCDVCDREPCPTPSFCQSCREADAKAAAERRNHPRSRWLRRLMDDDISLERAYYAMLKARPTPDATIEAVKQAVRDRGLAALKEANTRERLSRCDDAARAEIDRWLQQRKRAAA